MDGGSSHRLESKFGFRLRVCRYGPVVRPRWQTQTRPSTSVHQPPGNVHIGEDKGPQPPGNIEQSIEDSPDKAEQPHDEVLDDGPESPSHGAQPRGNYAHGFDGCRGLENQHGGDLGSLSEVLHQLPFDGIRLSCSTVNSEHVVSRQQIATPFADENGCEFCHDDALCGRKNEVEEIDLTEPTQ